MKEKYSSFAGRRSFLRAGLPLALATAGSLLAESCAGAGPADTPALAPDLAALRALPVPAGPAMVHVAGYRTPGDGGGGTFVWDARFDPGAANLPDDGGTYLLAAGGAPDRPGRWRRQFSGPLNVKWFGALGDDTGSTPAGMGADIATAPWNSNWPAWIAAQRVPRIAHFTNRDSWDYIAIQLALLSVGQNNAQNFASTPGEVYLPGGHYRLSQPLLYTGNMRATLTGAGMYQTVLTKTQDQFTNTYILGLIETGGQPATIRNICFLGPTDAQSQTDHARLNFLLIYHSHANGVHIASCWLSSCHVGILYQGSSDCFVTDCTAEYCATVINMDAHTDVHVSGSNFWQSSPHADQYTGIETAGNLTCLNSKFVGFEGAAIRCTGGTLHAAGNSCVNFTRATCVIDSARAGQSVISGNRIVGSTTGPMLEVGSETVVTGNYLEQQGEHACIDLAHGAANACVTGNVLCCKPAATKIAEHGLIVSVLPNVNFGGGCSQCVVTGNALNQPNSIAVDAARNQVSNNQMSG